MSFEKIEKSEENIFRKAEIMDIPLIRKLLLENLGKNLSIEERKDGFVTYEPSDEELQMLIKGTGIFLNLKGDELKGYFMTSSAELGKTLHFFNEMIEEMENMEYGGLLIKDFRYGLLLQINISKKYRRGTTFFRLHTYAQTSLKKEGFELAIGEVADENTNSLAVHRNLEDVGTYISKDNGMKWHVLVADLRED